MTDSSWNILVGNDNFNNSGTGYTNLGQGTTANITGYMTIPQGTTKAGFIPKATGGTDSTYFCDDTSIYASSYPYSGGNHAQNYEEGIFRTRISYSNISDVPRSRLMYL
jgi:hypothetical protein